VPEGDTIAWAANRIRPVLEGRVPDEILTPQPRYARDRWSERLSGRPVRSVDTHGKHLFLRFDHDLVVHSHLRMSGAWGVPPVGPPAPAGLAGPALRRSRGGPVRRTRA
jgi:endonuclease VIII